MTTLHHAGPGARLTTKAYTVAHSSRGGGGGGNAATATFPMSHVAIVLVAAGNVVTPTLLSSYPRAAVAVSLKEALVRVWLKPHLLLTGDAPTGLGPAAACAREDEDGAELGDGVCEATQGEWELSFSTSVCACVCRCVVRWWSG